jgi:hypothetical protein
MVIHGRHYSAVYIIGSLQVTDALNLLIWGYVKSYISNSLAALNKTCAVIFEVVTASDIPMFCEPLADHSYLHLLSYLTLTTCAFAGILWLCHCQSCRSLFTFSGSIVMKPTRLYRSVHL